MKIDMIEHGNILNYYSLRQGDVFNFCDNDKIYYMKTSTGAVNLDNGEFYNGFSGSALVTECRAKMVLA